jgi:hypothetical protein
VKVHADLQLAGFKILAAAAAATASGKVCPSDRGKIPGGEVKLGCARRKSPDSEDEYFSSRGLSVRWRTCTVHFGAGSRRAIAGRIGGPAW